MRGRSARQTEVSRAGKRQFGGRGRETGLTVDGAVHVETVDLAGAQDDATDDHEYSYFFYLIFFGLSD